MSAIVPLAHAARGVFQPEALLAVGSVRLAIYAVIGITGRAHCGLAIDERAWSQWGADLIVAAALLRAGAAWAGEYSVDWMAAAGLCGVAVFGLLCVFISPVLWRVLAPRWWQWLFSTLSGPSSRRNSD